MTIPMAKHNPESTDAHFCVVQVENGHASQVQWSLNSFSAPDTGHATQILSLALEPVSERVDHPTIAAGEVRFTSTEPGQPSQQGESVTSASGASWCPAIELLSNKIKQNYSARCVLAFVLPAQDGYIVRNDFIKQSMRGYPPITSTQTFVEPLQHCTAPRMCDKQTGSIHQLLALLHGSAGVVECDSARDLHDLDGELENRLSWPWTVATPLKPKRVVAIGEKRRVQRTREAYNIAKALAISVVVFASPGHWMEDEQGLGPQFREHFVPFTIDDWSSEELASRITEKVRALPYDVDGVFTISDVLLAAVAQSAQMLGLPTLDPEAYRRGTDKFDTRKLSKASTMFKVTSVAEVRSHIETTKETLQYPLIVKPTRADGSLGVTRVDSEGDLMDALKFAFDSLEQQQKTLGLSDGQTPVVVETYCDGPEVDVNMLVWNGELLHAEVVDNFPCLGNAPDAKSKTFGCVGSLYPSELPQEEQDMLKRDVLDIVRKVGMHTGVIHAEAGVHNSAMQAPADQIGLRARKNPAAGRPSTFLLEINPRPGGWPEPMSSLYTYGIDFHAAQLLHAVGDETRFRAIARGFQQKPTSYYAWTTQAIESPESGRMPHDLGLTKLGLADSYAFHVHYWEGGEEVPSADKRLWPGLGFLGLRSLISRKDVLQKVIKAKDHLHVHVV